MNDVLTSWNEDLVSVESAGTLAGLFLQRVERSPERPAYRSYDRDSSSWLDYSWREMAEQVARWQAALAQEGLRPGDRVAIQLRNCPEWVIFDQACLGLQLVTAASNGALLEIAVAIETRL